MEPQVGEIWRDKDRQHSLVLEVFEDEGEMFANLLCLDNGQHWEREPFECWDNPTLDRLPYYRVLVG